MKGVKDEQVGVLFIRKHCKEQVYKYTRKLEEYCDGDSDQWSFYAGRLFSYQEILRVVE